MTVVLRLPAIKQALLKTDLVQLIEDGFISYSQGKVVVPPVGEMLFDDPPGEVHLKYGFLREDDYYVVKIASGFYENVKLGLPTSNGVVLVFSQQTGSLECVLLDEGHLTNIRTAVAGAVVARCLAPSQVDRIGIVGAGIQGQAQLRQLRAVTDCNTVMVWGMTQQELDTYVETMAAEGFEVEGTRDAADIAGSCNLIVTATPSHEPLLRAADIQPGTHITAVGSDAPEKIELDPEILAKADVVVADSLFQSQSRGEIHRSVKAGFLAREHIVELGAVLQDKALGRTSDDQITVADLTGVAVQDIQIAKAVLEGCEEYRLSKSRLSER